MVNNFNQSNRKSMASNHPTSNDQLGDHLPLTPSAKEVPTAVSMMVDSMSTMIQRAKEDLEEGRF